MTISEHNEMIEGLSHITFVVRDLDRMASFLKIIFDVGRCTLVFSNMS